MKIVVATQNPDKLREIQAILNDLDVSLVTLSEFEGVPEVVEDGKTVEENALKKARTIRDATGLCALGDDTGLEVDALGGAPGVFSARYAGGGGDYQANNRKLLTELADVSDDKRTARFRCVMALALTEGVGPSGSDAFVAEGILEGRITHENKGAGGFGYDPVFEVPHLGKTLSEIGDEAKNRLSHRYRALVEIRELLLRWGLASANQSLNRRID
jgi:XTP/dITP diphosphohydrolase